MRSSSSEVLEARLAQLQRERERLQLEKDLFSIAGATETQSAPLNSLSLDQKAAVCLSCIEKLTTEIGEQEALAQQSLETLGILIEESEIALRRAKKEAFEFRRDILVTGETETSADQLIRWLESRLVATDVGINKFLAKNENLKEEISRCRRRLNEQTGSSKLQFIDFHEQQIEHAALEGKTQSINAEIGNLKKNSTVQIDKMVKTLEELETLRKREISDKQEISRLQADIVRAESDLATVEDERDTERKNARRAKLDLHPDEKAASLDIMSLIDLEIKKTALATKKNNLLRKLEIAQGVSNNTNRSSSSCAVYIIIDIL